MDILVYSGRDYYTLLYILAYFYVFILHMDRFFKFYFMYYYIILSVFQI